MPRIVRVKEPVVLTDPESGAAIVPTPAEKYRDDAPLVREYPWAFEADADDQGDEVERATAIPGDRRSLRRR